MTWNSCNHGRGGLVLGTIILVSELLTCRGVEIAARYVIFLPSERTRKNAFCNVLIVVACIVGNA